MPPKIKYIGKIKVERTNYASSGCDVVKLLPAENSEDEPSTTKPLYLRPGWDADDLMPLRCANVWPNVWIYKRKAFRVEDSADCTPEEIAVRIEHMVLKSERDREAELERIKAEVAALKNLEQIPSARRERIPESVQMFVWQRDQGQCVQCGSRDRLEFDHIIPVVKGGSNTGRNQLLCEASQEGKTSRVLDAPLGNYAHPLAKKALSRPGTSAKRLPFF